MTTTPLDWRAHLTEEEARDIKDFDTLIVIHRGAAMVHTQQRELIRRRVTNRVKARMKREKAK